MKRGSCPLITATNLVKTYKRETVLNHVSLSVQQGSATCVIGPNGSGKSTLLGILSGLLRADSGEVLFQGKPLAGQSALLRQIGFVPQQDSLFADLTVRDNLSFWAAAAHSSLARGLAIPAVAALGVKDMLRKPVEKLSGGMRRRTAIAAALLADPRLLILDEPFTGLDLSFKQELAQQLLLLKQGGITILYTSHNADEILPLSDTVCLLNGGRIALQASSESLPQDQGDLTHYLLLLIRGENAKV